MPSPLSLLVVLVGLAIVALGAWGVVQPRGFVARVELWQRPERLRLAAAIRFGAGVVLLLGAPGSGSPGGLRLLGVGAVVAGVATLLIQPHSARAVIAWFEGQSDPFIRACAVIPVALGLWLVWVA